MRIAGVEVVALAGQGRQGAYGAPYGVVVRLTADSGLVGHGEADSMPAVVRAVIEAPAIDEMMSGLKWVLLGQDPLDIEGLWRRMARATSGFGRDGASLHAMAAIDLALWDLKGKALGQPVHRLLGGARRRTLRCYATHPLGRDLAETAGFASALRRAGFSAVKFGWSPLGPDPERDEAIVRCLRGAVGEEADLLIDGGMAWDLPQALERCRRFAPSRPFWLEEPLPAYDFAGYARLRAATPLTIAAGEMAAGEAELGRLAAESCVDVLQVDISRVGLTQGMRIAARAAAAGIPCVNHTYGYGISLAASLHFAAAIERTSLFEIQATPNEIREALVPDAPRPVDGMIAVPDGPGLGVQVDPAALARFAVALTARARPARAPAGLVEIDAEAGASPGAAQPSTMRKAGARSSSSRQGSGSWSHSKYAPLGSA
ncbi:MAG: mandelate racemase/muconate lactonizing enzyme family protein [Dongiaceae bacterium]